MPWALQADLLSMSYRAHLISEYDLINIKAGQPLAHYIYALNLKIFSIINSDIKSFFPQSFGVTETSMTSSVGDWLSFVEHKHINYFLFVLKLPHLLADILVFYLITKIFQNKHQEKILATMVWWFNPVNLYAFYVFSRHDSLTIAAITLSLLFILREKLVAALLALFMAIQIRFQPLMYLPLFVINLWKNNNQAEFFKKTALATASILLILLVQNYLPYEREKIDTIKGVSIKQIEISNQRIEPTIEKINFVNKAISLATTVGGKTDSAKLFSFIGVFILINFFYLFSKKPENAEESLLKLNAILYLSTALYFLFNDFSPHYFVWLSGFTAIAVTIHKKFLPAYLLSILGWGIMGIFDTGNFAITQNLFLPVSPLLFNTPQVGYVVTQAPQLVTLGRFILDIGLIWSGFIASQYVFKDLYKIKDWQKVFKLGFLILSACLWLNPNRVAAAKLPIFKQETSEKVSLEPGIIYQNEFTVTDNEFGSLDLKFATGRSRKNHQLLFRLKEVGANNWYYQATYNTADFYNNAFYPFGFPIITNSENKTYLYELEIINQPDLPFAVYHHSYIVSREGSLKDISQLIRQNLRNKWQNQQPFFTFWTSLLTINAIALLAVILKKCDNQPA